MKKTLTLRLALVALAVAALALPARADAPTVRGNSVTLGGPATAEEIAAANAEFLKNGKPERMSINASKIDDATLDAICKAWPEAQSLTLKDSPAITTLAPLANLKKLSTMTLRKLAAAQPLDPAPLASLTNLLRLDIEESNVACADLTFLTPMAILRNLNLNKLPGGIQSLKGLETLSQLTELALQGMRLPDLAPLAGCAKVRQLNVHYAILDDLAPVAAMPALVFFDAYGAELSQGFAALAASKTLHEVYYYAAKLPNDDFSSLGQLKQVKVFRGGLTKMTSIEWVKEVPQIERLSLFAEKVADLSPIATAAKLTYFRGWSMSLGDLSYLSGKADLAIVELPGSTYATTAPLATLANLTLADLSGAKKPVDLAFVKSCPKLETLTISESTVTNFEALAGHPALRHLTFRKTKGVTNVDFLADCPKLSSIYASKDVLSEEQAKAIKDKAAAAQRRMNVSSN